MFLQISTTSSLTLNEPKMFLPDFLRKMDSRSRTKTNSSTGLIRACVRTEGRDIQFSRLDVQSV